MLTSPDPLATGLTGTVVISANATASTGFKIESVTLQVDGATVGKPTAPPYSVEVDVSRYPAGQHVFRASARDTGGNVSLWRSATVQIGGSRVVPAGFTLNDAWLKGLKLATAGAQAPDGRLFIAEQGGTLRVVKDGVLLPTPFVTLTVDSTGERGLIGVALHPQFATNGWVYVHYTTPNGRSHNRVSRFKAQSWGAGDVAVAGSEQILVDLPALGAKFHNGGAIHFGTDGKLYVGVGDNKVSARAQDLTQPFGKLLRFNPDGSIPLSNPFQAQQVGLARAIWAYGLRNPFTFAVDPESGRIHINDVGENTWEEIDLGASGANYGWPLSEGNDGIVAGLTGPLFTYKHTAASPPGSGPGGFFTGYAIAGGAFYPSSGNFPVPYQRSYYFADYGRMFVGRVDLAHSNAAYAFATLSRAPVDLMVDNDGSLLVLSRTGITRIARQ